MNRLMVIDLLHKFNPTEILSTTITNDDDKESNLNLHYNLLGETAARLLQSPTGFFDECNLGIIII